MKKIFLLTVLLFQLTIVFAQKPQWGPWTTMACYKGIQYSVANLGYDKSTNKYWWNVRWKNNYSKAVSFDGEVVIDGENSLHGGFGNIQPGGVSTYTSLPYKSNSTNFTVTVNNVCFADRYGGCSATLEGYPNYAECDNGTPNYKVNAKRSASTNSNSNSQGTSNQNSSTGNIDEQIKTLTKRRNELCLQVAKIDQVTYNNICDSWQGRNQIQTKEQTLAYLKEDIRKLETRLDANGNPAANTSKNDLTEYNRSKADLERQIEEKNAEGKQKSQNYTQAMNAGINAHNSGNYAEAKRQFSIALNNCNTEDARLKAKDYYDKTINAERSQHTISAVKSIKPTLMNIAKSIDDASAEKRAAKQNNIKELLGKNQIGNTQLFHSFSQDVLNTFNIYGKITFDGRQNSDEQFEKNKDSRSVMFVFDKLIINTFWTFVKQFESMYNRLNIQCGDDVMFNKIISEKPYNKFINKESIIKINKKSRSVIIDRISIPDYSNNFQGEAYEKKVDINSLTTLQASLNSSNKNIDVITQNLINYFGEKKLIVLKQTTKPNKAGGSFTIYYFDENEELYIVKYNQQNEVAVFFTGKYIEMGKSFYKDTKCAISNESSIEDTLYTVTFSINN